MAVAYIGLQRGFITNFEYEFVRTEILNSFVILQLCYRSHNILLTYVRTYTNYQLLIDFKMFF